MGLIFPTIAETVVESFRSSSKTTSIATLARKAGAEVIKDWSGITYIFDDDTYIETSGRGRSHRVSTYLP